MAIWIVLGVVVLIVLFFVSVYNGLVKSRNLFKNAFAQIDVQLKRRYDLIPNLIETVKGYMKHEASTLEAVIAARNQAAGFRQAAANNPADAESMKKLMMAESQMSGYLNRLMVVAEQYPDLKANSTMANLQEELTSTENKISFARQAFNDAVMHYNTSREVFPNVFVANMFGFAPATLFEISNVVEREAPKVSFN